MSTACTEGCERCAPCLPGREGPWGSCPSLCCGLAPSLAFFPPSSSSGKLVIKDQDETIVLRTRHILIDSGGELHAGSALCPFQGNFSIVLYGRWVDSFQGSNATLGSDRKEASRGERWARQQALVQDRVISTCCHIVIVNQTDDVSDAGEAQQVFGCGLGLCFGHRSLPAFQPPPSHVRAQGGSVSVYLIGYDGRNEETFHAGFASGCAPSSSGREF